MTDSVLKLLECCVVTIDLILLVEPDLANPDPLCLGISRVSTNSARVRINWRNESKVIFVSLSV